MSDWTLRLVTAVGLLGLTSHLLPTGSLPAALTVGLVFALGGLALAHAVDLLREGRAWHRPLQEYRRVLRTARPRPRF